MIRNHRCTLTLLLTLCAIQIGFSQSRIKETRLNTQRSIQSLIGKINTLNEFNIITDTLKLETRELFRISESLFDAIEEIDNFDEIDDSLFINSLEFNNNSIIGLVENWESKERTTETIRTLKEDYELKLLSTSPGISSTLRRKILVKVYAYLDDSREAVGYDVKANYKLKEDKKPAKFLFNNQTNDAKRILAPGKYLIWLEKDGEIKDKREVSIGSTNDLEEKIIFRF